MLKTIIYTHLISGAWWILMFLVSRIPGVEFDVAHFITVGSLTIFSIGFLRFAFLFLRGIKRFFFGPIEVRIVK